METAAKILLLGGLLNLAYGLLTGIPATIIRQKKPTYSKYLRFVHVGSLMWGPILISLAVALSVASLSETMGLVAAWLMVISSILLNAKDTINWLRGTQDEFAQKAYLPLALGVFSSIASFAGVAIILFGVLQG